MFIVSHSVTMAVRCAHMCWSLFVNVCAAVSESGKNYSVLLNLEVLLTQPCNYCD